MHIKKELEAMAERMFTEDPIAIGKDVCIQTNYLQRCMNSLMKPEENI